ncbi:hypothetical protein JXA40_07130 [bacterium]|nr:hypothetical protein [candidate division CSSED10-310 bacterium]
MKTPKGEPFEVYIRQALIKRLKAADLYSEDSSRILEGHLQEIEMSTSPGSWTIHVKFNRGSRESFDVLYVYKFMAGYYASQAQVNAAEEFPNAVREFIEEVIENPGFRKFIGN